MLENIEKIIRDTNTNFVNAMNVLTYAAGTTADEKGWYVSDSGNAGEKIALMHAELSEALEAYREGNPPSVKIPFSSAEEELADTIIRIFDFSHHNSLRLGEAIVAKMLYNLTRPVRHGGKAF